MTQDALNQILSRLKGIEEKRVPTWIQILSPVVALFMVVSAWGTSVETRMATMQRDVDNVPGKGWLKRDVQELKEQNKEILSRLRALEQKK